MEVLALALGRAHSAERSGSRTFAGGSRAARGGEGAPATSLCRCFLVFLPKSQSHSFARRRQT